MNADDPKFTAHLLGEIEDLTPAERGEIEALLANDPAAAIEAAETRALTARLRAELLGEAAAPLEEHQRAAVFEAARTPLPMAKVMRFPRRATWFAVAAACAVVGISIGLVYQALQTPDHVSISPPVAASSVPENLPTDLTSLARHEPPSQSHVQLVGASTPAVPPVPPVPPIAAQYASNGILKTSTAPLNLPPPTTLPQMASFTTTNINTTIGLAVVSTGVINVNGSVVNFSSSTVTMRNTGSNVSVAQPPALPHLSGSLIAANTATGSAQPKGYKRPENPPGLEVEIPSFQGQNREARVQALTTTDMARAKPAAKAVQEVAEAGVATKRSFHSFDLGSDLGGSDTNAFEAVAENDFLAVHDNPLSTFSVDVDTASYAIVRRFLNSNQAPPKGAVRTEELLNYFTYDYPQPKGDVPFSATMEVAACPWAPEHRLVRVGLKGREVPREQRPPSNIVFLIDVSGSMNMPNKLPLLQQAFRLLIDQLGPRDRVAIVTYAGSTGVLLASTQDKEAMQAAVDRLRAGGSTNGASGVQLAYRVAEQNFIRGGTNRVVLATDGDWNVGVTNQSDLLDMIAQKAKGGVFLTVLGFGMDNLKDSMLVKLADRGNGHYAYIDTPQEAKKVFVEQLSGTLVTIAKDVKIQVEFNPAKVGAYRLIGYEKRLLAKEDFNNDKKDAGEIGAGHTVTALYEVVPAGREMPPVAMVDKLKYQPKPAAAPDNSPAAAPSPQKSAASDRPVSGLTASSATAAPIPGSPAPTDPNGTRPVNPESRPMPRAVPVESPVPAKPDSTPEPSPHRTYSQDTDQEKTTTNPNKVKTTAAPGLTVAMRDEMLTLKLRYKAPDGDKSTLLEFPLTDPGTSWDMSSPDFRFAAAVAGYGMLLHDSGHRGQTTWESVAEWAHEGLGVDKSGYREEFLGLVRKAQVLER